MHKLGTAWAATTGREPLMAEMDCPHSFFQIDVRGGYSVPGTVVMCAFCGERRTLWGDGRIHLHPAPEPPKVVDYDGS